MSPNASPHHSTDEPSHGARLDAADPQWHLTSPTPYDPPLTYGGWTQCRALGARIAALLQAREAAHDANAAAAPEAEPPAGTSPRAPGHPMPPHPAHGHPDPPRPRRTRHRIVMHSSPFLRCVQTATAVAAGLSQYHGLHAADPPSARTPFEAPSPAPAAHGGPNGSSGAHLAPHHLDVPARTPSPGRAHSPGRRRSPGRPPAEPRPFVRPRLRLDAFLGEWLSPDYFEDVAPPPGSALMVAGAKAELLRRGEPLDPAEDPAAATARAASGGVHFPGGWTRDAPPAAPDARNGDGDGGGDDDADPPAADDLARLTLSPSAPAPRPPPRRRSPSPLALRAALAHDGAPRLGYVPPRPRHPLRPVDPIPAGYVAHARDACLDVDYAWDSRGPPPRDWGDGGSYGEEWSAMHRRFRAGLAKMVGWYRRHTDSALQGGLGGHHERRLHPVAAVGDEGGAEPEEEDLVLVLVTHGAGCNALIGALTGQPVLLDVGLASLTMAVRRDATPDDPGPAAADPADPARAAPPPDPPLPALYAVLLTASTEHLRAGSHPLAVPALDPPPSAATARSARHPSFTPSPALSIPARSPRPRPGALGSLITRSPLDRTPPPAPAGPPRSASGHVEPGTAPGGGLQRSATVAGAARSAGNGLWRKPAEGVEGATVAWLGVDGAADGAEHGEGAGVDGGDPARGLWGRESFERAVPVKRRWTLLEGR